MSNDHKLLFSCHFTEMLTTTYLVLFMFGLLRHLGRTSITSFVTSPGISYFLSVASQAEHAGMLRIILNVRRVLYVKVTLIPKPLTK